MFTSLTYALNIRIEFYYLEYGIYYDGNIVVSTK